MYSHKRLAASFAAIALVLLPAVVSAELSAEERVRQYFWDIPVMTAIAKCESEFRQFNSQGVALRGGYKKSMVGLFQIAPLHIPAATALNIDIKTMGGNMAFARHLYEQSGTRPWLASKWCWQDMPEARIVLDDETKIAMIQKQIDSIRLALEQLK